jgi:hypothetical protein
MGVLKRLLGRSLGEQHAIIWCGSFEDGGGATIGDIHAVENLSDELRQRSFDHIIACTLPLRDRFDAIVRGPRTLRRNIKTIIFVGGPLADSRELRAITDPHGSARKVAVGVTVFKNQAPLNSSFDVILPRSGAPGAMFDLALARFDRLGMPGPAPSETIGVCLLGLPSLVPLHRMAESLLLKPAVQTGAAIARIDTVIEPTTNPVEKIERGFAGASMVATTTLHGALYSLAHGRPTVAVDQEEGGGEISEILGRIGWPLVFRADQVDEVAIDEAFSVARSREIAAIVQRCRADAITQSAAAVKEAGSLVEATGRGSFPARSVSIR